MSRALPLGLLALLLTVGPADASSTNGRIAYDSGSSSPRTIRTTNPDGSGDRLLVVGDQPSWSPDGSRLVYASPDRSYGRVLYVVDADGSDRRPLGSPIQGYSPDWSPDGRRVAFAREGDLYSVELDGSQLRQLTAGAPNDDRPAWSPDGKTIAFNRDDGLWLMDSDGGNQRALDLAGRGARFSPDGARLAYSDESAVYVVATDGSGSPGRITPEGLGGESPAWSPDGSRIAFVFAGGGICTVRAGGGDIRRVSYAATGYGLDWQPRSVASRLSPYPCVASRWDLRLSVERTRARAAIERYVQFRIVLTNRGPHQATDTAFEIGWPGETEFSALNGPCRAIDSDSFSRHRSAVCEPGVVYPGTSVVVTISVRMQAPGPQRVFAQMVEFPERHDTNAANDRASAVVRVGGCTITGTTGADVLLGTPRRDVICGLDGHDVIRGRGGNDEIWGGDRADVIDGGPGHDRILGGDGPDDLDGGDGRDVVWGGFGNDNLFGGRGDDALHGGDRLDRFDPSSPPEEIDVLDGGFGSDVVDGGAGNDIVRGGRDADLVLSRDRSRDRVDCGHGRDRLEADRFDRQRRCERVSRR